VVNIAARIFYFGFASLPEDATMCDAREATEMLARAAYGLSSARHKATKAAWDAVGIHDDCYLS
jgi:Zn-dependent metalloprotease